MFFFFYYLDLNRICIFGFTEVFFKKLKNAQDYKHQENCYDGNKKNETNNSVGR